MTRFALALLAIMATNGVAASGAWAGTTLPDLGDLDIQGIVDDDEFDVGEEMCALPRVPVGITN